MSTYYIPTEKIKLSEYKKIRGLKVKTNKYGNLFQANGSTLHYSINSKKEVIDLMRYNTNNADDVLDLISEKLDIFFVSEHDNGYRGLADKDTNIVTIQLK